jgi:thioredoxin-related protein
LKALSTEYNKEAFDFVAIECTSKNTNALKSYKQRNDFDYTFLLSTKEVLNAYSITSFPVFFILDEKRTIVHVLNGYGSGSTDKEIRAWIKSIVE